jgi:hypothetical protein
METINSHRDQSKQTDGQITDKRTESHVKPYRGVSRVTKAVFNVLMFGKGFA